MDYSKHIPEWQEIITIIRQHWISVFDRFIIWLSFGAFIPVFLYSESDFIRDIIPYKIFEGFLFLVFFKILYELFNWYNDAWVVTQEAIYDIEWSFLKTRVESIHLEHIEWVEIDKDRIWDSLFRKGDIIIHKFWEEEIALINAYNPEKAVEILEELTADNEPEQDEELSKFDMIMDTLWGVVKEYLQRNGLPEKNHSEKNNHSEEYEFSEDDAPSDDSFTLDLRNEKK